MNSKKLTKKEKKLALKWANIYIDGGLKVWTKFMEILQGEDQDWVFENIETLFSKYEINEIKRLLK